MAEYGKTNWQETLDDLKEKEGGIQKSSKQMALGELTKIYKRIILEKGLIDIAPHSAAAFGRLMTEDLPQIRNALGHRPGLEHGMPRSTFGSNLSKSIPG